MMNKERIVESNVEAVIVGNILLGAVHSCSRCKWLYWNKGEKQFDCGLGYLDKAVKDDLQQDNDCNDFEHCANVLQLGEVRDFYPLNHKRSTNFK